MARLHHRNYDEFPPWTIDEVRSALDCIKSADNELWVKVGMIVRSELGDAGLEVFMDWCESIPGFSSRNDITTRWRSFNGAGLTVRTLYMIAKEHNPSFGFDSQSRPYSDEERAEKQREIDERRKQLEDEKRQKEKAAADQAENQWYHGGLTAATGNHPYLLKKRVGAYGVKLGTMVWNNEDGEVRRMKNAIVIALRDMSDKITTLQAISADGTKILMARGQKSGSFHKIQGDDSVIIFAEGYATAATIYEATGATTVACIDAGNIPNVVQKWREAMPMKRFIIAADNDKWSDINAGVKKAKEAAAKYQCEICVVEIDCEKPTEGKGPTDFNDLMLLKGIDAVRAQLMPLVNNATGMVPIDSLLPKRWWLDRAKTDKIPMDVKENLEDMMAHYGITIRQNAITKSVDIDIPGIDVKNPDNRADQAFLKLTNIAVSNDLNRGTIGDHCCLIAMENAYNPVELFIKGREWDGVSRFPDLFDTITFEDGANTEFYALLLRRWLISAVAAAVKPHGFYSKGVLVFQGVQSLGKTAWIKSLVPSHMSNLINTGAMLDPSEKDSVTGAIRHWIVELGELDATVRLADMAKLKAFVTRDTDTLRLPYARLDSKFQRRTVFFASVNPRDFQKDVTGSTRWWTMAVTKLNYTHDIDLQQLWAEVHEWYKAGERWWLDSEEEKMLERENETFKSMSIVEMSIREGFKWDLHDTDSRRKLSVKDILKFVGFDKPSDKDISTAREVIKQMTGEQGTKSHGVIKYSMPPVSDVVAENIGRTSQRYVD